MDHPAADGHGDAPLVLIVDDERDIADMLDSYFRLEGYRTLVAHDAGGALAAACRASDVILLDVNLPDGDGFSVCREVREIVACPIIFLTARVEDADALSGFAAGGDDYVTKPFSLEVLGARVRAQLKRDRRSLDRATVRFPGGVSVDLARREVRVDERVAQLARKDFDIVALLAKRPGQVFGRDMIYERVWGEPDDSSVVTEHVWRIAAIATIGRIPSIVTSTLAAGFASSGNWAAAGVTLAATVVLAGAGAAAYGLVRRRETAA